MPSITFEIKDPTNPNLDNYRMDADDILLFPKVDINLRETYCNVGLWNLIDSYGQDFDVCYAEIKAEKN